MALKDKSVLDKEKAVFLFQKGSQVLNNPKHGNSYYFIRKVLENLMATNNVVTDTVFIGGHIEDLVFYLSGLIEIYSIESIKVELADDDILTDTDFGLPNN